MLDKSNSLVHSKLMGFLSIPLTLYRMLILSRDEIVNKWCKEKNVWRNKIKTWAYKFGREAHFEEQEEAYGKSINNQ